MSTMPWNPPMNGSPLPPAPKKTGIFGLIKHLFRVVRIRATGWFLVFVGFALVPLIIKVMTGLGIGFVTYQLGSFALAEVLAKVQENIVSLPPEALAFVGIAKIDEAISIVFSGIAVRLSMMGFNALGSVGKQKSMIWQA